MTFLKDPDVLALMQSGPEGHIALWAWVGLLLLAKDQQNGGVFRGPIGIYGPSIGMSPEVLVGAVERIAAFCKANGNKPWIVTDDKESRIRNWDKWNLEWGGSRRGAGRKQDSSAIKMDNLNPVDTPLDADSASASASASEKDKDTGAKLKLVEEVLIPLILDTPAFREAWARWGKHRKEIRKPLKPTQMESQLKMLSRMGPARAIATIEHTVSKGWQGLVDPSENANGKHQPTKPNIGPIGKIEKY